MELERGEVFFHSEVSFACHVVGMSAPVDGFFQHGFGNGVVQGGVSEYDDILESVDVIVGFVWNSLESYHAVRAVGGCSLTSTRATSNPVSLAWCAFLPRSRNMPERTKIFLTTFSIRSNVVR
jgi:hypothetical protein